MAKQHFLQANFTGSLGGVTGQNIKGQNVIKQKKWAKCHNGVKSNNACYSFTALHRICCKAAPALADTLLEKTKKMIRMIFQNLSLLWKYHQKFGNSYKTYLYRKSAIPLWLFVLSVTKSAIFLISSRPFFIATP